MEWISKFKNFFNQKVLLCDLDGTLIVTKSGKTFPENEDDWKFKDHIKEAIQEYNPKYIFIISNQGGIEKGFVDEGKFIKKMQAIRDEMDTWGDFIIAWTYCTSNDPNNEFRKPNTGMIDSFRHDYALGYDFDNRHALMIGDASGLSGQFSDSDLQCAKNAGIRYCDVDHFIEAMHPCLFCPECYQGDYPCPMDEFKSERLKRVIIKNKHTTMEDYKKKYEEAMLRMNKWVEGSEIIDPKEVAEFVFPELKESEDEMIRKWLIKAMKHLSEESTFFLKVPKDKVIAWLEKQGEQKPIDKVEPKFKLGDWVVHKETGTIHQIQQCVEMPTAHTYGYDLTDGGYINTFRTDEYRLWTIQDAKDGDVLYIHSFESDCVFLYQNTYEIEPNRNVAVAYCCIDVYANKIEFGIQGPDCIDVRNIKPATKEQRDLLFQKMKEAEYEWDAEKKELKKIEQKSTWSEEDDDNIMMIEDRLSDYLDYIREDITLTKHQKNCLKEKVIGYVNCGSNPSKKE